MDEKDIAPELLERIRADFLALLGDAQQEADTYTAAAAYAELVGSALADAFRRNLTADILPDGRLYWNIADRVCARCWRRTMPGSQTLLRLRSRL